MSALAVLPRWLTPKRPRWFAITAGVSVASVVLGIAVRWWRGWSPGDWWGLTFGILAALLMLLASLYPLRRRLAGWLLPTVQDWLQAHVYGGTLAAVLVLVHMGFRLPHGQFGWWLFGLTVWTTVSGLIGVALQKWIPGLMARHLTVEVIYERVPDLVARLQEEAGKTMAGASDVLQRFYDAQVQPALAGLTPSWSYLFDVHAGRAKRLSEFEHIRAFVGDADQDRLQDLKVIVTEKMEIEAHYALQRALRLWPLVHVPPAMLLMAAIVFHMAAVWYY
jgi:hypothetical protein